MEVEMEKSRDGLEIETSLMDLIINFSFIHQTVFKSSLYQAFL